MRSSTAIGGKRASHATQHGTTRYFPEPEANAATYALVAALEHCSLVAASLVVSETRSPLKDNEKVE